MEGAPEMITLPPSKFQEMFLRSGISRFPGARRGAGPGVTARSPPRFVDFLPPDVTRM
jgi:hypothetical protein